jgi:hypothetical protein
MHRYLLDKKCKNLGVITIFLLLTFLFYAKLNCKMSKLMDMFLGIDISTGTKPVTFVAIDEEQQALAIGEGDIHDVLAFAAGQTGGALAAVNAAAYPNSGRMARPEVRHSLVPPPGKGKFTNLRQVEFDLIQAGMEVPLTPASADKSLPWVKRGFTLVEGLKAVGYHPFPQEEPSRQWIETQADAAFWSLLGVKPLPSGTLEGRIQRQLVLLDQGLKVPDAMDFFEEITRFKLLKSNLPIQNIFSQGEINAWISALTAWLAYHKPGMVQRFGEEEDGFVYLPCII